MVSFYDKLHSAEQQELPVIAKLKGVFDALDDAELLKALQGKVHRGCQGYSVAALWRSYLTGYVLGIPTVAGLIRRLESDPLSAKSAASLPFQARLPTAVSLPNAQSAVTW